MKKMHLILFVSFFVAGCVDNISNELELKTTVQPSESEVAPTVNPAESSDPENFVLTIANLEAIPPEDVIQEISYLGRPGGGGAKDVLKKVIQSPMFLGEGTQKSKVEIFNVIFTTICGLAVDEKISIEVSLPNGSFKTFESISQQNEGESYAQLEFDYVLNLHDPTGVYIFVFRGDGWTLQRKVDVIDANSPRLYLVSNSKLIFYKFQPRERIRLFAYRNTNPKNEYDTLIGWKEFRADDNGEFSVDINMETSIHFIAIGDNSGEVIYRVPNGDKDHYLYWFTVASIAESNFYCPGAPVPIGLKARDFAKVVSNALQLYSIKWQFASVEPQFADLLKPTIEKQIGTLSKGTIVSINSNPTCIDKTWWWNIVCRDKNCSGYVQEANAESVFLEPVQEFVTNQANENSSFICPGAPKSESESGQTSRVTFTNGLSVRLRKKPGISGKVIDKLSEGTQFQIFGGPECLDGMVWWKVELISTGEDGWVAEGDMASYFIEPYE